MELLLIADAIPRRNNGDGYVRVNCGKFTASFLCGRTGRWLFQAQLIGDRSLDNGTLEEGRIVGCVQHSGIRERELANRVQ